MKDKIQCMQCGKYLHTIGAHHFKKCLGEIKNIEEYKKKFPHTPLLSVWSISYRRKGAVVTGQKFQNMTSDERLAYYKYKSPIHKIAAKKRFDSWSEEEKAHWRTEFCKKGFVASTYQKKPNKKEQIILNLFKGILRFAGHGDFWIKCKNKSRNPDFSVGNAHKTKKVIELFGKYWHSKLKTGQDEFEHEKEYVADYADAGYQCLVIWEQELNNISKVKKKIELFIQKESSETRSSDENKSHKLESDLTRNSKLT